MSFDYREHMNESELKRDDILQTLEPLSRNWRDELEQFCEIKGLKLNENFSQGNRYSLSCLPEYDKDGSRIFVMLAFQILPEEDEE